MKSKLDIVNIGSFCISGHYIKAERQTYDYPGSPSEFEIIEITVPQSKVNLLEDLEAMGIDIVELSQKVCDEFENTL